MFWICSKQDSPGVVIAFVTNSIVLLTNATVVDDAIRFVYDKSKDKEKMESSDSNSKEESNKPDYDNEDQLEEQEEETGEILTSSLTTTTQIF
jgi:hypothetical protein